MRMAPREQEQKRREILACEPVVLAINYSIAADYYIPNSDWQLEHCKEPADVSFLSKSGLLPSRTAQVVTLLSNENRGLRTDSKNLIRLKSLLVAELEKGEIASGTIG